MFVFEPVEESFFLNDTYFYRVFDDLIKRVNLTRHDEEITKRN